MSKSSVPREILDFIELPGNHSFLVKGLPGTGKTIFSLSLMKEFVGRRSCIYLTSGVSERDILSQHPWLKEEMIFTPDGNPLMDMRLTTPSNAIKVILDSLRSSDLVIIDSWDYYANLIPREDRDKAEVSIVSSASALDSFVIFVGERLRSLSLDYLVDGIVSLRKFEIEGRLVRELVLEKLRGVRIRRTRYIFTLKGGLFRYSEPWNWKFVPKHLRKRVEPTPLTEEGSLPSKIEGLDEIIGGGWKRGSINLLEVYEGVGNRYLAFLVPSGQTHIQRGDSLIDLPSTAFREADIIKSFIEGYVYPEPEERLRFILPSPSAEGIGSKYVLPIYLDEPEDAARQFIKYASGLIKRSKNEALYMIIGLDTLENEMGPDGASEFLYHVASWVKTNNVFCFVIMKEGQRIPRRIIHIANTHFKIRPKDGSVVIYGVVPETKAMILETSFEKGYARAYLIPIE